MSENFTEFNITPGSYVSFDATSFRKLIIQRLKARGDFTDQVFEGSNLSSIIDIIAYSYHTLMFYLNRTSNESMFSEAQLYENMNRIVKLLNYKPVGYQTSVVSYNITVDADLPVGVYTIPRYTTVDVDGIPYTFPVDVTFGKPDMDELSIAGDSSQFLLYQGEVVEYPQYTAVGDEFEIIVLALDPSLINIDHFNVDVYVKTANGDITHYEETSSLYLESPGATKYEKRLNENRRYEFRFGNNINGRKLETGDTVMIYYISSDRDDGVIGTSALKDKTLTLYTTPQFNLIKSLIKTDDITYFDFDTIEKIHLNNTTPSTTPKEYESVDDIRNFSPQHFISQDRLITANDFTLAIKRNFGNILNDTITVGNEDYIAGHLSYITDIIGVVKPTTESRILFNQANFSSSTNFNNVYVYCVPRTSRKTSASAQHNFLPVSQKELIKSSVSKSKALGLNVVFQDPVYMAVDLGVSISNEELNADITKSTSLELVKSTGIIRNSDSIKQDAYNVFVNYFNSNNCTLGQEIEIDKLLSDLLSIEGVQSVRTTRTDLNASVSGLSLMVWNPVYYNQDMNVYNQNIQLPYYKFPYFYNELTILSRIIVTEGI